MGGARREGGGGARGLLRELEWDEAAHVCVDMEGERGPDLGVGVARWHRACRRASAGSGGRAALPVPDRALLLVGATSSEREALLRVPPRVVGEVRRPLGSETQTNGLVASEVIVLSLLELGVGDARDVRDELGIVRLRRKEEKGKR